MFDNNNPKLIEMRVRAAKLQVRIRNSSILKKEILFFFCRKKKNVMNGNNKFKKENNKVNMQKS